MPLPDGTVVPSFMGIRERGNEPLDSNYVNLALRQGEVKKIIYPGDPDSVSKKFNEYVVEVQQSDGREPGTSALYVGVMVADLFGGLADFLRYTLRADDGKTAAEDGIGNGSKVTILCLNGSTNAALIVGGVGDAKLLDDKADGHHLFACFNGLSLRINKDGEFKLEFLGKTTADGKLDTNGGAKAADSPTTFEITKDGSLEIYTKDRNQFWKLDHANKKFMMQADTEWNVQVNGKYVAKVDKEVDWTFGSTCSIAIQKDTLIDVKGGKVEIKASDKVYIKSAGVHIGSASEDFPMFSTYRSSEETLHNAMKTALQTVSISLNSAAGMMKVPMTGSVAASVPIQAAATAIDQLISAISTFEGQSGNFKSKKNKND